jgi:hypothetical protein
MDGNCFSASRREFLAFCSAVGVGSTFFAGTLFALTAAKPEEKVTVEMIDQAAALAGIDISRPKAEALLSKLNEQRRMYETIRRLHLPNDVPPAFRFDPLISGQPAPPIELSPVRLPAVLGNPPAIVDDDVPKDLEKLAFATVQELGVLLRSKKVSVTDLTEMYLTRLKRFNPQLSFLISSPKSERGRKPANWMPNLPGADVEERCTESLGAPKICWQCAGTLQPGGLADFNSRFPAMMRRS